MTEFGWKINRHLFRAYQIIEGEPDLIDPEEAHSMCFEVVAMLVVQDGKLKMLRDFPVPGAVFELGKAFQAGGV